jgi:hypothetical protein
MRTLVVLIAALAVPAIGRAAELPIVDAHLHYSHDAWSVASPKEVVPLLRKAGVVRALVSSSDDDGTQKLLAEAPDIIVPELRPYRRRGEISTWAQDPTVISYLEERLGKYRYVAIGEFHLYGADADLPVPRRMVQLAKQHGLMLHAHSDADAIERLFRQDPSFRSDHGAGGKVAADWRPVFLEFPDRFMVGTDTFTPERLFYVPEHAAWSRAWLADLPPDVAERIAWKNGEALFGGALGKRP